jgi:primosomal protein N'
MEDLGPWCKNCSHSFRVHQQSTYQVWFCDAVDNEFGECCDCNSFEQKRAAGTDGDEIEVPYDNQSYRWN